MNAEAKRDVSAEAEVSRAIDDVLAAEKDAADELESAAAAAQELRRQANEDVHRIMARADRRIGAVHRSVASAIRAQTAALEQPPHDDVDSPDFDLDASRLQSLADAVAQWLTTDVDD